MHIRVHFSHFIFIGVFVRFFTSSCTVAGRRYTIVTYAEPPPDLRSREAAGLDIVGQSCNITWPLCFRKSVTY